MLFLFILQHVAITMKDVCKMKHKSAVYLFVLTLIIGLTYQLLPYTPLNDSVLSIVGTIWNLVFAFSAVFSPTSNLFGAVQTFSFHRFIVGCPSRHFDWRVLFLYLCRYFWTTNNQLDQRNHHCPNGLFASPLYADGRRIA